MRLVHRSIPREFLEVLPEGVKFIHRHGKEFLVVEELLCPQGHSLMADSVRIHDEPSISIAVQLRDRTGLVYIDAYWGSHAKLFDFMADPESPADYTDARCPHCGASLAAPGDCARIDCDSNRSLVLRLPGDSNVITACARLGCPEHRIIIGGLPQRVQEEVSRINFFGCGVFDEAFEGI
jgi:hypothetical protein